MKNDLSKTQPQTAFTVQTRLISVAALVMLAVTIFAMYKINLSVEANRVMEGFANAHTLDASAP
ncbi:hypothetical protein AEAC466_05330 [Asticcacaulis sp. AC466]|uniref:hypothetical protein n=1 Tax=Asticcacaulis sp. AC466 TaxID=1282362 RepID=UPI0003C3C360|nr:hypothetical protein [Asticcacaulis sp. AC466]ESQ85134.1 hypothetical protein AEAC466_05330 [Asticcacaulis sp. AC466]